MRTKRVFGKHDGNRPILKRSLEIAVSPRNCDSSHHGKPPLAPPMKFTRKKEKIKESTKAPKLLPVSDKKKNGRVVFDNSSITPKISNRGSGGNGIIRAPRAKNNALRNSNTSNNNTMFNTASAKKEMQPQQKKRRKLTDRSNASTVLALGANRKHTEPTSTKHRIAMKCSVPIDSSSSIIGTGGKSSRQNLAAAYLLAKRSNENRLQHREDNNEYSRAPLEGITATSYHSGTEGNKQCTTSHPGSGLREKGTTYSSSDPIMDCQSDDESLDLDHVTSPSPPRARCSKRAALTGKDWVLIPPIQPQRNSILIEREDREDRKNIPIRSNCSPVCVIVPANMPGRKDSPHIGNKTIPAVRNDLKSTAHGNAVCKTVSMDVSGMKQAASPDNRKIAAGASKYIRTLLSSSIVTKGIMDRALTTPVESRGVMTAMRVSGPGLGSIIRAREHEQSSNDASMVGASVELLEQPSDDQSDITMRTLDNPNDIPLERVSPQRDENPEVRLSDQTKDKEGFISDTKRKSCSSAETHHDQIDSSNDEHENFLFNHPPLPPGWVIRVSKSKKRVFYCHPDFGSTWHCPVILPATSASPDTVVRANGQGNSNSNTHLAPDRAPTSSNSDNESSILSAYPTSSMVDDESSVVSDVNNNVSDQGLYGLERCKESPTNKDSKSASAQQGSASDQDAITSEGDNSTEHASYDDQLQNMNGSAAASNDVELESTVEELISTVYLDKSSNAVEHVENVNDTLRNLLFGGDKNASRPGCDETPHKGSIKSITAANDGACTDGCSDARDPGDFQANVEEQEDQLAECGDNDYVFHRDYPQDPMQINDDKNENSGAVGLFDMVAGGNDEFDGHDDISSFEGVGDHDVGKMINAYSKQMSIIDRDSRSGGKDGSSSASSSSSSRSSRVSSHIAQQSQHRGRNCARVIRRSTYGSDSTHPKLSTDFSVGSASRSTVESVVSYRLAHPPHRMCSLQNLEQLLQEQATTSLDKRRQSSQKKMAKRRQSLLKKPRERSKHIQLDITRRLVY